MPLPEDMDLHEKKKALQSAEEILFKAKRLLDSVDFDESMTFEQFLQEIKVSEPDYIRALSTSQKGKVLILQRKPKERFINNYNSEMIQAWDANIDLQLALDPYAVITYIVSYVNKDESGMTKFLQEALHSSVEKDISELLKILKMTYLTHRQVGESEAVYKVLRSMKLKDSNVACVFVASGFPDNRSVFYKKVVEKNENFSKDDPGEENVDNIEEAEMPDLDECEIVTIEGRSGQYKQAITVHDRYLKRPILLENICLAQFAINYTYASKVAMNTIFDADGNSQELSEQKIFGSSTMLPKYLDLTSSKLGFLRLRTFPAILRTHSSKRKEGHEQYYSELILFCPWRNEEQDFQRWSSESCEEVYRNRLNEIRSNKSFIYPSEDIIDLLDSDDLEDQRPTHVFDMLDSQREQENEDDKEVGMTDDPKYAVLGLTDHLGNERTYEEFKYRKFILPDQETMNFLTLRLVSEQSEVLKKVIQYCKDIVKFRSDLSKQVEPVRLIVHGGAGNLKNLLLFWHVLINLLISGVGKSALIKAITMQSEKVLRKSGDHPNHPHVLVCAPTGKAASLIGK